MADSVPVLDVIKIWSEMKSRMVEKFGIYQLASGAPAIIDGKVFPLLTMQDAQALRTAWNAFADSLTKQLTTAGQSPGRMAAAMGKFESDFITWFLDVDTVYGDQKFQGKYLFAPAVRDLFLVLDRYVISLSTQAWSTQNIENAYDRALDALKSVPGGGVIAAIMSTGVLVAKGVPKFLAGAAGALHDTASLVQYGVIGMGLWMVYWYGLRD